MPKVTLATRSHDPAGSGGGPYSYPFEGGAGGPTQFGAHVDVLSPGARASRHRDPNADEMVYLLSGELMLIEYTDMTLRPGEAACWQAGRSIGSHLENRSADDATYLVTGARARTGHSHDPDLGLNSMMDEPRRLHRRRERPERPD